MQKLNLSNRRKHERIPLNTLVEYSLHSSSNNKSSFYGIISDISESGMCLLTPSLLKNGEKILLKMVKTRSKIVMVRWSGIGGSYYKTGLEFV